jgi:hypothetical protein
MPKKKPYYPNNWKAIKDAPAEYFDTLSYDEFMEWKMNGWVIPSSIDCIVREENLETGKISERVYTTAAGAKRRVSKKMDEDVLGHKFTICSEESIHYVLPRYLLEEEELADGYYETDV